MLNLPALHWGQKPEEQNLRVERRLKLTNTIYIVGPLRMVAPPLPGGTGLPCHGTGSSTSRRHCRISIAGTQTCLLALSLLSSYNTIHSTQCSECMHFQWLRKILLKSERSRRSNIIYHKIFASMLPKKWNNSIFLHRNLFQRKRPKRAKRPNEFFKANQLEMKPKKFN